MAARVKRATTTRSTQTEVPELGNPGSEEASLAPRRANSRRIGNHETSGFVLDDSDETSGDESSAGRADRHTIAPSQAHPASNENVEARARQATSFVRCDPDWATDRRGALLAKGRRVGAAFDEARHAEAVEGTKAVLAAQRKHRRCDSNPLVARVENNESTEDGVPSGSQQQRLPPRQSC